MIKRNVVFYVIAIFIVAYGKQYKNSPECTADDFLGIETAHVVLFCIKKSSVPRRQGTNDRCVARFSSKKTKEPKER